MLRESLDRGARHAILFVENRAQDRFRFSSRAETDGWAFFTIGETLVLPQAWIQIRREGDEFIGLSSVDGTNWTEVRRQTLELPPRIFAGVAATGRDSTPQTVPFEPLFAKVCNLKVESERPEPEFRRGDANDDGAMQLTDAVSILNFLFVAAAEPTCLEAADTDDNGAVQVTDAVRILNFLFTGGGAPPSAPGPEICGPDPEGSPELGCGSYTSC